MSMAVGEIKRRPGGRSSRVRSAVLAATVEVAELKGFDPLSIADVSERSGVHETSIYRRWGTRENLMIEAFLDHSGRLLPTPDTGDVRTDLIEFGTTVVRYLSTPFGVAFYRTVVNTASSSKTSTAREYWLARYRAAVDIVERGIARGQLGANTDPGIVIELVISPLHMRALVGLLPLTEDLPKRLVDAVFDGLQAAEHPAAT